MGNSVSGHNIDGGDAATLSIGPHSNKNSQQTITDYILMRQLQQQQQQQHWSQKPSSHSNNGHNNNNAHIKVLPELKSGPRLRTTNNGCILHNGGTISGRKDSTVNTTTVNRSRSLSSPFVNGQHDDDDDDGVDNDDDFKVSSVPHRVPAHVMQRSRTQLEMPAVGRRQPYQLKSSAQLPIDEHIIRHFGSQPNLLSAADGGDVDLPHVPTTAADTNNNRVQQQHQQQQQQRPGQKKKRAAPPAPRQQRSASTSSSVAIDYDPCRFGWKSMAMNGGDETKAAEAKPAPPPPVRKLRLFKTKAESSTKTKVMPQSMQPFGGMVAPPVPPAPLPKYRREKSFDLSLLLDNRASRAAADIVTRQRHRQQGPQQSDGVCHAATTLRKMAGDGPTATKIDSSSFGNDFKRELLAATRRRSMAIVGDNYSSGNVATRTAVVVGGAVVGRCGNDTGKPNVGDDDDGSADGHFVDDIDTNSNPNVDNQQTKTFYFGMDTAGTRPTAAPAAVTTTNNGDAAPINSDAAIVSNQFAAHVQHIYSQYNDSDSDSFGTDTSSVHNDYPSVSHLLRYDDGGGGGRNATQCSEAAYHMIDAHDVTTTTNADPTTSNIQVRMRPTLPRRQFEIPRFSPAAAWRTLAHQLEAAPVVVADSGRSSSNGERRIQRIYRATAAAAATSSLPFQLGVDNKSGDSGISGDGGGGGGCGRLPSPDRPIERVVGPFLSAWTPQQDLGDDDDDDDDEDDADGSVGSSNRTGGDNDEDVDTHPCDTVAPNELRTKPAVAYPNTNVFSLSLPRDCHAYGAADRHETTALRQATVSTFNSLQKLKRTVSGAFGGGGANGGGGDFDGKLSTTNNRYRSDNWLLSRSAPNSIETVGGGGGVDRLPSTPSFAINYHSLTSGAGGGSDSSVANAHAAPFQFLTSGKHVMYLPLNEATATMVDERCAANVRDNVERKENLQDRQIDGEERFQSNSHVRQMVSQPVQPPLPMAKRQPQSKTSSRAHRFTFQSTIRQIERRRLAERLSKEAEQKEAQRLSELEAMQRVEQEFQKKRAREKASIRHQLRLVSMHDVADDGQQFNSLPIDLHTSTFRAEPDGAVAATTNSPSETRNRPWPPSDNEYTGRNVTGKSFKAASQQLANHFTTEVLSEFHTSRREYVEYRSGKRNATAAKQTVDGGHPTTKHPAVVCKIPQTNYTYDENGDATSDNYRRDFAHGRSVCSSDSELSTSSANGQQRRHQPAVAMVNKNRSNYKKYQ